MHAKRPSCPLCCRIFALLCLLKRRAALFSILDWAVFKTALISFGMCIGVRFSKPLRRFAPLFAAVFIAGWLFTSLRLLAGHGRQ